MLRYELRNAAGLIVAPWVGYYLTRKEALIDARRAEGRGLYYGMHPVLVRERGHLLTKSAPLPADLRAAIRLGEIK